MADAMKNKDTELLKHAILQTLELLASLEPQEAIFIRHELFVAIGLKFKEAARAITSLLIMEIADLEFFVRVNGHAEDTMLVKRRKGGSNG